MAEGIVTLSLTCTVYHADLLLAFYDILNYEKPEDLTASSVRNVGVIIDEIMASMSDILKELNDYGEAEDAVKHLVGQHRHLDEAVAPYLDYIKDDK